MSPHLNAPSNISQSKRKRTTELSEASKDRVEIDILLDEEVSRQSKRSKGQLLQIEIPGVSGSQGEFEQTSATSLSSLFSATDDDSLPCDPTSEGFSLISTEGLQTIPVSRTAPQIPGLFFNPSLLLPQELSDSVMSYCMETYFQARSANQVMLFARFLPSTMTPGTTEMSPSSTSGLPPVLLSLLDQLSSVLKPTLPPQTYELLFPSHPTKARQAIINLYQPGEGITPHVDLLGRYGDGIIGVSFGSGCAMRFDRVASAFPGTETEDHDNVAEGESRYDLFLPERSIIVLSQDARYLWTHGIEKTTRDFVFTFGVDGLNPTLGSSDSASTSGSEGAWIDRGTRLSVTFRWLLPGADVVGDAPPM